MFLYDIPNDRPCVSSGAKIAMSLAAMIKISSARGDESIVDDDDDGPRQQQQNEEEEGGGCGVGAGLFLCPCLWRGAIGRVGSFVSAFSLLLEATLTRLLGQKCTNHRTSNQQHQTNNAKLSSSTTSPKRANNELLGLYLYQRATQSKTFGSAR